MIQLGQQLLHMSGYESEKIAEYSSEDEFWVYFVKFRFANAAAFAAHTITKTTRVSNRKKQVLFYLERFCELFKVGQKTFISKSLLKQVPSLVAQIPELKEDSSKNVAVGIMF